MGKVKSFNLLALLLMIVCSVPMTWAGETHYYKTLSVTVRNPDTAKGRVYLMPFNDSDTTYSKISNEPNMAQIVGNFSNVGNKFLTNLVVVPEDGYVLDCMCTLDAYDKGDFRSDYMGNPDGYPLSSLTWTIDTDTTMYCSKTRPEFGSTIYPVGAVDLYAIFVPSKKMTVKNITAGNLPSVVRAGTYGEAANDLTVIGPINNEDIEYLNSLSQEKGLIRLDLSGASFSTVPDKGFYDSGLFELKLPSTIKSVGDYAFALSKGLKPVKLPSGIPQGKKTTAGCLLMKMMGVKEAGESIYDASDFLLF